MKARVKETGEIVNVTPNPTWYKENGQGPDRREWDEDELEIIPTSTKKYVDIEKACEYWMQRANESENGIIMYFIISCIEDFKKTMEE